MVSCQEGILRDFAGCWPGLQQVSVHRGNTGPLVLVGICWAGAGESVQIEQYTNLAGAIEQVAREIRSQYILSYQPSNLASPGKFHRVNLKVSPPPGMGRVYVSWRHGYYEPRD